MKPNDQQLEAMRAQWALGHYTEIRCPICGAVISANDYPDPFFDNGTIRMSENCECEECGYDVLLENVYVLTSSDVHAKETR